MSQQADPPPISIPPPGPIRAAGGLLGVQALGLVALAVATVVSGARNDAGIGEMLAQGGYFLVIAVFLLAIGAALNRGRRWGRTPAIVVQIIVVAVGFWLAFPSGQLPWGSALVLLGIGVGYLLICPPATAWIESFPPLFGPDTDR